MNEPFSAYHPAVNFIFFTSAVLSAMFLLHPCFLCISAGMALLYYVLLTGIRGVKFLFSATALAVFITLLNPLFNTNGNTVLFRLWDSRPYTWEALTYGFVAGAVFLSVILWFACYNRIMTSDKFIYLFGRLVPAVSLVLTMVFRLIPNYQRSAQKISNARKCIGKFNTAGTTVQNLKNSMAELSALTSSALENSILSADSMKSRGYGCAERTAFSQYNWCAADRIFLLIIFVTIMLVIFCGQESTASFLGGPPAAAAVPDAPLLAGAVSYALLLFLPSFIHIKEELQWKYLRSKI